jgi:hypothetical protein
MQRGSQIQLSGYGDLKMTGRRCGAREGDHCGPWVAQIEITQAKTP